MLKRLLLIGLVLVLMAASASAATTLMWNEVCDETYGATVGAYAFVEKLNELSGGTMSIDLYINGMLGGQSCDVEHDGQALTENQVEFINKTKTGALIEGSLMIGAILAGADSDQVRKLEEIGSDIGLAFQIRDDILDVTGNAQETGKPICSDVRNKKTTYI